MGVACTLPHEILVEFRAKKARGGGATPPTAVQSEAELRAIVASFQSADMLSEVRVYEALLRASTGSTRVSISQLNACAHWQPETVAVSQRVSNSSADLRVQCRRVFHL